MDPSAEPVPIVIAPIDGSSSDIRSDEDELRCQGIVHLENSGFNELPQEFVNHEANEYYLAPTTTKESRSKTTVSKARVSVHHLLQTSGTLSLVTPK